MTELSFNVDNKFDKTLSDLVESNDAASNKADVIQRAVATYKYFRGIPSGAKIQVVDQNGTVITPNVAVP